MVQTIIAKWDQIEQFWAGILVTGAFIMTFIEVIARFVFSYSFYWAKEYIIFFIIWSTFLGASQVLKKSRHIRLSVFVDLLPKRGRRLFVFLVKRNSEKNRAKIRNSPFGNPKKIAGHFCLMRACFMR